MIINSFQQFTNESKRIKAAAGVAITFNGKLLVVHPTGASWKKSAVGIPKGGIEPGEELLDAAIRELREETGISLDPNMLRNKEIQSVDQYNSNGDLIYILSYYVLPINNLSEIGIDSLKINKKNLQLEEIDWAGFIDINEIYPIIHRSQLIILDRIK